MADHCVTCAHLYGDKLVCGGCTNGLRWELSPIADARLEAVFERRIMDLWREHSGSQHGPHTETVTMPLGSFREFVRAFRRLVEEEALR